MMNEIILLKMGEIVLKGLNRQSFEDKLLANVRRRAEATAAVSECSLRQSTIYVEPQGEDCDMDGGLGRPAARCSASPAVARAVPCEKDSGRHCGGRPGPIWADAFAAAKSFKVESKRADKTFPMNSIQLSQACGRRSGGRCIPDVAVDVHHPELDGVCGGPGEARLRPRPLRARGRRPARGHGRPGGDPALRRHRLPGVLLDDGQAGAWRWRWSTSVSHALHLPAGQGQGAGAGPAADPLDAAGSPVHIVPFTEIQEEIRRNCPEELLHPDHAPVHDAHRRGRGQEGRRRAPWSPASPWARWPARPCWPWGSPRT